MTKDSKLRLGVIIDFDHDAEKQFAKLAEMGFPTCQGHVMAESDLSHDRARAIRQMADKHGIELSFQPRPDVEPAWLDPRGVHTCLANLITNAFDACRAASRHDCRVELRLVEQGGAVVFEVQDTGGGMTPDTKQKIFRSLFTTKGLSGTGLGLVMTDFASISHVKRRALPFASRSVYFDVSSR